LSPPTITSNGGTVALVALRALAAEASIVAETLWVRGSDGVGTFMESAGPSFRMK
jgi:hypothetical protein